MPGGEKHQRNAGGLVEVERIRNRDDIDRRNRDQLAVAAVDGIAKHGEFRALVLQSGDALRAVIAEVHGREQHALADFESGHVLADFDDFTGDVAAENVRQLHAGQAFAHPDIEMVHGAGFHADQDLIFARLRIGNVFVAEHFGSAEFVNADGFHGVLIMLQSTRRICDTEPAQSR